MIPAPHVQHVRDAVVLQGQALIDAAVLVAAGIRATQRDDGIRPHPRLRYLADLLATAAAASASAPGHAAAPPTPGTSSSLIEEITTTEAATMLGLSTRQVRRLAPRLGARSTAAGWLMQRGLVEAHRNERSTAA